MRKQCKRKRLTPTVNPVVFKLEASAADGGKPLEWRVVLAGIVNRLKDGSFDHDDATALHEFISTCYVIARMARREDIIAHLNKAGGAMIALLQRRRERDKWIATGDEINAMAVVLDDMAEALGSLPESTIRVAMARADLEKRHAAQQYLRAAGWRLIGEAGGGSWDCPSRPRVDQHPTQTKLKWEAA
ncbi:Uncharacterized protein ChrSV_2331 [Chromobacterium vaccinii]|nr:Uncharacterized protein ChrSW_2331 [Chromobacterium vaccinii]QND89788.1 Uncharacterized protein ChrSV_2331 [Chromobacterium vaccinii]